MKKLILILFAVIVSGNVSGQEKKQKRFWNSVFKYSTFYSAYSETNSIQAPQTFYVSQDNELIETTENHPADMMFSFGWRKLANFQYEDRDKFYDGDENNVGVRSNIGNTTGLEYLAEVSRGRQAGRDFDNQQYFLRYLAKWWLVKGEYNKNELVDIDYKSAEVRFRAPIGKKLSISLGGIYRTYEKAYGYNPIESYLEDNNWWNLSYSVGHTDVLYQMVSTSGQSMGYDYQWFDPDGELLASSDADYRNSVFQNVVNQYNKEQLDQIGSFADLALVLGVDFYHYRKNVWIHFYGNVLGKHKLINGDERYSYNNHTDGEWLDWSAGGVFGFKVGKNLGVFTEVSLQQYWDRKISVVKAGINYKL
tara:strand:- start:321 stop:1412 length:1092 start_codon:yes stop_codon:yes gene_type:complete